MGCVTSVIKGASMASWIHCNIYKDGPSPCGGNSDGYVLADKTAYSSALAQASRVADTLVTQYAVLSVTSVGVNNLPAPVRKYPIEIWKENIWMGVWWRKF